MKKICNENWRSRLFRVKIFSPRNLVNFDRSLIHSFLFIRTILWEHRGSNLVWNFFKNFPNESLGQVKHFKHVFGLRVGWEFEKMWIKIQNIRASGQHFLVLIKKECTLYWVVHCLCQSFVLLLLDLRVERINWHVTLRHAEWSEIRDVFIWRATVEAVRQGKEFSILSLVSAKNLLRWLIFRLARLLSANCFCSY